MILNKYPRLMPKPTLAISLIILSTFCVFSSTAMSESNLVKRHILSKKIIYQHSIKGFEILGVLQLDNIAKLAPGFNELSGLEWDEDENILFAISDEGGLFHLKPIFKNDELVDAELLSSYSLKDRSGKPLSGKRSDSEGLALINHRNGKKNDTELLISFEQNPRIIRYQTNGEFQNEETLMPVLREKSNYQKKNKQLEAITHHPVFGYLTGPERPLVISNGRIDIYSNKKLVSRFSLANTTHGSLVGLTTLPNGNLLALERVFINIFAGFQFTLHHLKLNDGAFIQETLLSIHSVDGFFNDNFEGIAHHKNNYFFMISDDNDSAIQRTLLVYFRLPELEI